MTKLEELKKDAQKCYGNNDALVVGFLDADKYYVKNSKYIGSTLEIFIDMLEEWFDSRLRCRKYPTVITGWYVEEQKND